MRVDVSVRLSPDAGSIPAASTILRSLTSLTSLASYGWLAIRRGRRRAKDGALRSAKRVGGLCSVHGGLSGKWMEMHYAYVIESLKQPGRLYRGSTRNVEERLAHHNAGKCRHTSKYRPWKLKLYIAFESKELAQRFERYLKSGSGHAFANRHFWD